MLGDGVALPVLTAWTSSPCSPLCAGQPSSCPASLLHGRRRPPLRDYQSISRFPETCTSATSHLADHRGVSLSACLDQCDLTWVDWQTRWRCVTAAYESSNKHCRLLRGCTERLGLTLGACESGSGSGSGTTPWCHFTRGAVSNTSSATRRAGRRSAAWRQAQRQVKTMLKRPVSAASVCSKPALLRGQPGTVVTPTVNKVWRYYTAFACGEGEAPRVCLSFKKMGGAAVLGGMASSDGVTFGNRTDLLRLPEPWREEHFTHNLALLPLGRGEYAMLGGKQGFVSNSTCRQALRASFRAELLSGKLGAAPLARAEARVACLQMDSRGATGDPAAAPYASGIRLSRGHGLPWSSWSWSTPRTVITGTSPAGCVDRRPRQTGYPRLQACEFDGRLSAVARGGEYLLYARANLKFGAVSGGRNVQVTSSSRLDGGWAPWKPVSIAGMEGAEVDLYFFAVQPNPLGEAGLGYLALFPLTEPPLACIAFAVSLDGVHFSHPVNLRESIFGVRNNDEAGRSRSEAAMLEWRGEDHPVAGAVRVSGRVLFYVHHAVKGTTIRKGAVAHVSVYSLTEAELRRETERALASLKR